MRVRNVTTGEVYHFDSYDRMMYLWGLFGRDWQVIKWLRRRDDTDNTVCDGTTDKIH